MKRMRSFVVVEAGRTRREVAYAVMRTERAAKRDRTVVRSIIKVVGGGCVSMSANWLYIRGQVVSKTVRTVLEISSSFTYPYLRSINLEGVEEQNFLFLE